MHRPLAFLFGALVLFISIIETPVTARSQSPVFGKEFNYYLEESRNQLVHMPATVNGLTGLLYTQSTDTLPKGSVEVAVGFDHQDSTTPDYTINEAFSTVTVGLPSRIELALHVPYMVNFESGGNHDDGREDIDLSAKWRFLEQNVEMSIPALALSLSYYIPTGNNLRFGIVDKWGIKVLLVASAEADLAYPVGSYIVGFYLDGGVFVRDTDQSGNENSGIIDGGILLPLSNSRRLQLLLEGNATISNEVPLEGSYTGATAALRYVTTSVNFTGGVQYRFYHESNVDNVPRLVAQASYLFN
ncbi:MAG TPA: hypothetical protein VFG95_03725 [Nitrospiria bacterium]|nr:hypothetical protein [Nitrospiria bacterium]